jgi:hypothetical protein
MSYIGTEPKDIRSFGRTKFDYTATQGQTAFTGADDDGKVLAFTVGQIEVYVNGILMDDSDFTTTGTGTVTLASAANLNDVINIVSFETNIPDSNYVPASGGTFTGNVTFSGTTSGIDMNGTELVLDADGDTGITADTDDRIDFKIAGSDRGNLHYDGNDFFSLESNDYLTLVQNQTAERGLIFGPTYFKPYNAHDNTLDLGIGAARFKDLYLSGGVYLGGTTASNKLDDYEEGTWTPTFYTGFSSISAYTYQVGHYIKVGGMVYTDFYLYFTGTGNNAHINVTGLPFNLSSQHSGLVRGGGVSTYNNLTSNIQQFYGTGSTDRFQLYENGNNGTGVSGTQTNKYLIGTFTYKTDA